MADERADDRIYHVVLNDEEQYSIWPAGMSREAARSASPASARSGRTCAR
jgi:MbtH protein